MLRQIPDWLIYGIIVFVIYLNASQSSRRADVDQPTPPEILGPMLPSESPRDPKVLVDLGRAESSIGTAFAVNAKGQWLTARHVVDSCTRVGLNIGQARALKAQYTVSPDSDTAVLKTDWTRKPLATDLDGQRRIGEHGYFFGFPQGRPGEAVGSLLGRHSMIVRGRYRTEEPILAWTELGRTRNLKGSLGGLSGGPVLNAKGEVVGLVTAESPRRGRIYSVVPETLRALVPETRTGGRNIDIKSYGVEADKYRRERRIAQVFCLVQ